jgi:hypothetical protein
MMAIAAGTYIRLGVSKPKKSATVGTGAISVAANEMALQVGSSVDTGNTQQLVGTFHVLFRYAKNEWLKGSSGTTTAVISAPPGMSWNAVVTTGHTDSMISLHITDEVFATQKSHFMDRTFKRLIERLLEEAK